MLIRNAALCATILVALTACAQAAPPQVDAAAEEQAIRALSAQWLTLDKAKDYAAMAALFADDGVLYREAMEPAVGTGAIQAAMAEEDARSPDETVEWTTDRVEVASAGDVAVEHGSWTSTTAGPASGASDRGKFLTTWRKVNGTWKVTGDISVSTTPTAAPPTTTAN